MTSTNWKVAGSVILTASEVPRKHAPESSLDKQTRLVEQKLSIEVTGSRTGRCADASLGGSMKDAAARILNTHLGHVDRDEFAHRPAHLLYRLESVGSGSGAREFQG